MRRPNLILKAAILVLALGSTLLAQQPSPPVAKPAGPTVQLSLIVTDSKNKSLNQVSKDDVHVIEDKVEQKVLSIAPDERPVDLVLAIDSSNSLRSLMRTVFEDFKKLSADRRKVAVIITDGEDRNSHYKQEALVKKLRESGVQIFALGLVTELDRESGLVRKSPRDKAESLLKMVTEETGGRVFFPRNRTELLDSMTQIISDLRGQFRLTYQSSNGEKKGFKNVEVKLISSSGEKRKAIVPRGYGSE